MKIIIKNLRCSASIGIYDWELEAKRVLIINASLDFDYNDKLDADEILGAIDYEKIEMKIINFISSRHFNLVEKLLHDLGLLLMADSRINSINLSITKPGVLTHCESVSIEENFAR